LVIAYFVFDAVLYRRLHADLRTTPEPMTLRQRYALLGAKMGVRTCTVLLAATVLALTAFVAVVGGPVSLGVAIVLAIWALSVVVPLAVCLWHAIAATRASPRH